MTLYNTPAELVESVIAPYRKPIIAAFITMPGHLHHHYSADDIEVANSHITTWNYHYVSFRRKDNGEQVFVATLEKALSLGMFALNEDVKALRRIIEDAARRMAENYVQAIELDHISQQDSWVFDADAWEAPFELLATDMRYRGWSSEDTDKLWQEGRQRMYAHLRGQGEMPELPVEFCGLYEDLRLFLIKGLQHDGPEDLHRWMNQYRAAGYSDKEIMVIMHDFSEDSYHEELTRLNLFQNGSDNGSGSKWSRMPELTDFYDGMVEDIEQYHNRSYPLDKLPRHYDWWGKALNEGGFTHEEIMKYVREKYAEWNDIPF